MTGLLLPACTRLFGNRVEGAAFENPSYTEAGGAAGKDAQNLRMPASRGALRDGS